MSNSIPLKDLIKEVENSKKECRKVLNPLYDKLVAQIIYEIGKSTAYDTGVTRQILQKLLRDELKEKKLAIQLEATPYEHWNTIEQRLQEVNEAKFTKTQEGKYKIDILSDSFADLDSGDTIVSTNHPRGLDPNLRNYMTEYVMDMFENGSNEEIEKIIVKLEEKILQLFEGRVNYK